MSSIGIHGTGEVTVAEPVTVDATDLDIRNLVFATDKVDASGSTLGANSGVDVGDVTINNAAGASAVNIQDGGNAITVDGTVAVSAVSGTVAVTQSGTWDEVGINDSGNSITVDNAALSVVGGGVELTALRVTVASDSTGVLSVDDNAGSLTVDGTVAVTQSGTWDEVGINDSGNSITVDWAGTAPPIGAGLEATALRVTLATDSTGLVSIDDNGASLTIDNAALSVVGGGVEATALRVTVASDSTGVLSVDDNGGALTVDGTVTVSSVGGTVAVTQSGTWDEIGINDSGNSITVDWAGTAPPVGAGVEATALRVTLATDSTGLVSVDDNAGSLTVDNAALSVVGGGVEATALRVTLASDSTGLVSVDDNAGSLTIDNAALSVVGGGVEATALRVTIASDSTGVLSIDDNAGSLTVDGAITAVGTIADDSTTPGAPVMVGGFAISPDGTDPGSVAEADVARFRTDLNRRLLVNTEHPQWWSYHEDSSNALTDASVQADPGDGFQIVITEIIFSTGAATACNIFFEEGASKVLGPWYLEAVAGRGLVWRGKKHITASTAVTVTTSAAIAHGLDVQGYIQAV